MALTYNQLEPHLTDRTFIAPSLAIELIYPIITVNPEDETIKTYTNGVDDSQGYTTVPIVEIKPLLTLAEDSQDLIGLGLAEQLNTL